MWQFKSKLLNSTFLWCCLLCMLYEVILTEKILDEMKSLNGFKCIKASKQWSVLFVTVFVKLFKKSIFKSLHFWKRFRNSPFSFAFSIVLVGNRQENISKFAFSSPTVSGDGPWVFQRSESLSLTSLKWMLSGFEWPCLFSIFCKMKINHVLILYLGRFRERRV